MKSLNVLVQWLAATACGTVYALHKPPEVFAHRQLICVEGMKNLGGLQQAFLSVGLCSTGELLQWETTGAQIMWPSLSKITEKTAGLESCDAAAEDWPEIENMFPFDPQGRNFSFMSDTVRFWPSKQAIIVFLWSPFLTIRLFTTSEIASHSCLNIPNCNSCAPDV